MSKYKENDVERLKLFLIDLENLIDEYHPNIYMLDSIFKNVKAIEDDIHKEIRSFLEDK
jgi:hypothetical protein